MERSAYGRRWLLFASRLVLLTLPVLLALVVSYGLRAQTDTPVPAGGSDLPPYAIWQSTLVDGNAIAGTDFDAAVDSAGQIHIVYLTTSGGRDAVQYAVGEPGAWVSQTVTLALTDTEDGGYYPILNPRIALDEDDAPHVSFWMPTGGFAYLHYARQEVSSWLIEAIPDTNVPEDTVQTMQIGFASDGAPLVVYAVFYDGPTYDLYWIYSNVRRPIWQEEVTVADAFPGKLELNTSPNGTPVVLHTSETTTPVVANAYGIYRAQLEGVDWSKDELSTTVPALDFEALIDNAGRYHVFSVGDVVIDGTHYSELNHQRLDTSGWTTNTIDLKQVILQVRESALQGNGQPALLYTNAAAGELYFAWLNGSQWSREQALLFPRIYDDEVDLVFADDVPYVVHAGADGDGLYIAQRTAVDLTERVFLSQIHQSE